MTTPTRTGVTPGQGLLAIVGLLVAVEVASGVLQGYYTPIFSDIADHLGIDDADVNWFEAAQLIVSALCVPPLARLGDLVGHKKVLVLSTAVTALASWGVAGRQQLLTRRAAAVLVGALELSVIIGALTSGALVEATSMTTLLMLPAIVTTVVLVLVWFGVEDVPGEATGGYDWRGLGMITLVLGLVMGGLIAIRLQGPAAALPWLLVLAGLAALVPFVRLERSLADPMVDVRLLARTDQWPIQLTAFLFGMSVLGAQIPLSTFARTDPDVVGYGLGADAAFVSTLVGVYVVFLAIGAFTLPLSARLLGPRGALVASSLLVALGYGLFLPFHDSTTQTLTNMAIARPHRLRDRDDQRDQDRRRRDRLLGLRDRPGLHGLARGARRGRGPALGLPHGLGGLLGGRRRRRGLPAARAEGHRRGHPRGGSPGDAGGLRPGRWAGPRS